ncbi:hypothetical protein SISNIDRAFT_457638 [Sistotremastrum niveocremeum HHB9708]|uniref:Uncharacterized protein n=1 Tax=Sistotremastrum niveocremeum HHB9708 TaxID=1314777 RepID=A0A164REP7_9AGAM|nr:hypothetical protein SISNIDRAFT_457638 [Sistotremastrum niveocremeum HHB9708]
MDEWVWDICRKNLPFPDSAQKGGENRQVVRSLSRKYVESPYPPRPSVLRPSSASFNLLRCVLDGIPTVASMSPADGNYCVVKTQDTPEQPEKYTWSDSVLRVLASCLESVIAEHGIGVEGWDAAKWEIYDKVSDSTACFRWNFEG